jgi:hypothetical protein
MPGLFRLSILWTLPVLGTCQTLKDCKIVFLKPMPEGLDKFIQAEIVKWGGMKVSADESKSDWVMRSSGTDLPSTFNNVKHAAIELIHKESAIVLWAATGNDKKFSMLHDGGVVATGPGTLAKRLVDQLKKDFNKRK